MRVSIIVAVSENGIIGREGDLPWRLSADLQRFKAITMGHHLIMGRKTFESIGRPLPGRVSVVLSRTAELDLPKGVLHATSLDSALRLASADEEVFVIGGAQIYALALPKTNRIYLTRVSAIVQGDVSFVDWDVADWDLVSRESFDADPRNDHPHVYEVYDRK